eukprot:c20803_g1_i1 orf=49-1593(+)
MDLLAPCRSCLQCLPFFHDSPPQSPRLVAARPSSLPESQEALLIATPTDPSHSSENLQCSTAAAAIQEQDLPLSGKEEEPQDTKYEENDDSVVAESADAQSSVAENEATAITEIIIAPPVSAASDTAPLPEDIELSRPTVPSELPLLVPFINDISFSTPGLHLPSPITPAAFGAAYPAGQLYPPPQTNPGQHLAHAHSHNGHDNSHHGHDHAPHGHDNSHHGHDSSHHRHEHSHHGNDDSQNGFGHSHHGLDHDHGDSHHSHAEEHGHDDSHHGHAEEHDHTNFALLDAVSLPHPPSDLLEFVHEHHEDHSHAPLDAVLLPHPPSADISEFVHETHEDPSQCDPHPHDNDGPSMDEDNHHDQTPDSAPLPTLEPPQSTSDPDNVEVELMGQNGGADVVSNTNGASGGLLETYHSEPIVQTVTLGDDANDTPDQVLSQSESLPGRRRRRRDHFKDQFKGITQQIKEGGHHLKEEGSKQVHHIKEEGSKHVQTIIANVNKQAQQLEQSGSFFNVPR